jgi:type I restriction enzyme S subunit
MLYNWKTYELGDIIDYQKGYAFKSKWYQKFGKLVVRVSDTTSDSIDISTCHRISEENSNKLLQYELLENDIVIASVGSWPPNYNSVVGKVVKVPMSAAKSLLNQNAVRLRTKDKNNFNQRFIYDVMKTKHFLNYIVNRAQGSASQASIKLTDIFGYEVNLPPLKEQTQIANILSVIDDKIENNLSTNKTLEDMAMALYKHWFVDFGPFQDGEFVESELGLIPKDWEVKNVKYFGDTVTGKTPSKKFPEHFGNEMSFVTPTDFKNYGKHILNAVRSISKLGIEKHKNNIIPINSVIVTCIGSDMGKVAISKTPCLTNQQINSLKCVNYHYLYCFFVNNYLLLKRLAGDGTTMPIINKSSFENIEVLYPGKEILDDFEKKIIEFDEQILNNTNESQTLTKLRDILLPKLISGEVRLKEFKEETLL